MASQQNPAQEEEHQCIGVNSKCTHCSIQVCGKCNKICYSCTFDYAHEHIPLTRFVFCVNCYHQIHRKTCKYVVQDKTSTDDP